MQEVINSAPAHDLGLQNIVTNVVSKHTISLVKKGAILELEGAFGKLGSSIFAQLMESDMVRASEEKTSLLSARSLDLIARKLNYYTCCRHCFAPLNVRMERRVPIWHFPLWRVPYTALICMLPLAPVQIRMEECETVSSRFL